MNDCLNPTVDASIQTESGDTTSQSLTTSLEYAMHSMHTIQRNIMTASNYWSNDLQSNPNISVYFNRVCMVITITSVILNIFIRVSAPRP